MATVRLCIDFDDKGAMYDWFRDAVRGRAALPYPAAIVETDALDFRRDSGVTRSNTFLVKEPSPGRKTEFSVPSPTLKRPSTATVCASPKSRRLP